MSMLDGNVLPKSHLCPVKPGSNHSQRPRQGLVQMDVPVQQLQMTSIKKPTLLKQDPAIELSMLIKTFPHVHKHSGYKGVHCQSRQAVDVQRSRLPNEQNLLCSHLLPSEQTHYSNTRTPGMFTGSRSKEEFCFSKIMPTFTMVMQFSTKKGVMTSSKCAIYYLSSGFDDLRYD